MKDLSSFQLALLVGLAFLLVVGVLIFAGVLPNPNRPSLSDEQQVTVWSTIPTDALGSVFTDFQERHENQYEVEYIYKDPRTIETEFVNALAAGRGPDLIIWPHSFVLKHRDKLIPIPYENIAVRDFNETYLRIASLYLFDNGIIGLPLYVDPIVLYSNQDLLTSGRVVSPPQTWTEMTEAIRLLTKVDNRNNILQAALALGTFNNLTHARDLLVALTLQAGNPIIEFSSAGPKSVLNESRGYARLPATEALAFFNRFADPANTLYTWNAAQPEARQAFSRGTLAMYLGYASEFDRLRRQNPQLPITVSNLPQLAAGASVTLGQMTGVSLVRASESLATAAQVAYDLSSAEFAEPLSEVLFMPPVLIDAVRKKPADPALSVFYDAAIIARGWLDPDPAQSGAIFAEMAQSVSSGREEVAQAVERGSDQLQALIK